MSSKGPFGRERSSMAQLEDWWVAKPTIEVRNVAASSALCRSEPARTL